MLIRVFPPAYPLFIEPKLSPTQPIKSGFQSTRKSVGGKCLKVECALKIGAGHQTLINELGAGVPVVALADRPKSS